MSSVAPTPDSDAPTASAVSPRRPWYRLHASTWVVAGLVGVVLAVLIGSPISQFHEEYRGLTIIPETIVERGWPWVFALHEDRGTVRNFGFGPEPLDSPAWVDWRLWTVDGDTEWFSTMALLGDAAASIGFALTVIAVFEARRRRRVRLSQLHLADLLATMLFVAVACAWWVWWERDTARENAALARLATHHDRSFCGPAWLIRTTGHRYCPDVFYRAVSLWLPDAQERDKYRAYANLHPPDGTSVNVSGLPYDPDTVPDDVRACRYVTSLSMEPAKLPDGVWVAAMEKPLTRLHITGSFYMAMARHINSQGTIESLSFIDAQFDDDVLALIAKLPKLRQLDLSNSPVTDAGIRHLRGALRLESLQLDNTRVTDEVIDVLASMPSLTQVWLNHCGISDNALRRLHAVRPQNLAIYSSRLDWFLNDDQNEP